MKAITTRYRGATNTRGARMEASDGDRNKVSIPYPHELNSEQAHAAAAQALRDKMGWKGRMIGGATKEGYTWVFADERSPSFNPAARYHTRGNPRHPKRATSRVRHNPGRLLDTIRPGDRVTIVDRFGKQRTGRATIIVPGSHVVLNMGGAHGTPGIANDSNIVRVSKGKGGGGGFVFRNPTSRKGALRFRDLSIGDVFEFAHEKGTLWSGATGPWEKLSARTYTALEGNLAGQRIKVGSINVAVEYASRPGARFNPVRVTKAARKQAGAMVKRYGKARARKVAGGMIGTATSGKQRAHFERVAKAMPNPLPMFPIYVRRSQRKPWLMLAVARTDRGGRLIARALAQLGYYVRLTDAGPAK